MSRRKNIVDTCTKLLLLHNSRLSWGLRCFRVCQNEHIGVIQLYKKCFYPVNSILGKLHANLQGRGTTSCNFPIINPSSISGGKV